MRPLISSMGDFPMPAMSTLPYSSREWPPGTIGVSRTPISVRTSASDLKNAHLCTANLGGRDLTEVKEADFIGADLSGADLSTEADLSAYVRACYNANLPSAY